MGSERAIRDATNNGIEYRSSGCLVTPAPGPIDAATFGSLLRDGSADNLWRRKVGWKMLAFAFGFLTCAMIVAVLFLWLYQRNT